MLEFSSPQNLHHIDTIDPKTIDWFLLATVNRIQKPKEDKIYLYIFRELQIKCFAKPKAFTIPGFLKNIFFVF